MSHNIRVKWLALYYKTRMVKTKTGLVATLFYTVRRLQRQLCHYQQEIVFLVNCVSDFLYQTGTEWNKSSCISSNYCLSQMQIHDYICILVVYFSTSDDSTIALYLFISKYSYQKIRSIHNFNKFVALW